MNKQRTKRRSLNSTALLVLEALRSDQRAFSAYELMDKLRGDGVAAPATVYRALERLIASGSVHRLETLNAYIACTHQHSEANSGAAFAICDECGRVNEFSENSVGVAAANWARTNSFALGDITFELRGTCRACRTDAVTDAARV